MTDEEMQKLQEQIVEGIEEYFDAYDWDTAARCSRRARQRRTCAGECLWMKSMQKA